MRSDATMTILLLQKSMNSTGLVLDIIGAILVANEIFRRFRGTRLTVGQSWSTMTDPPKETEAFQGWSNSRTVNMTNQPKSTTIAITISAGILPIAPNMSSMRKIVNDTDVHVITQFANNSMAHRTTGCSGRRCRR